MKKLLIFSDNPAPIGVMRGIGAYRLRTAVRAAGYQVDVVDLLSAFLDQGRGDALIEKYIDKDTVVAFSTTWFQTPPDKDSALSGSITVSGRGKTPCRDVATWFSFLQKIKQQGATVVFGGSNIFYFLNQYYQGLVDFFVVGFGDRDLVDVMHFLSGRSLSLKYTVTNGFGVIRNDNNFVISDIATEFLPQDHLNPGEVLPIEISRGCRFKCKFCYYPLNGRKKNDYVRDSEDLYSELMRNYDRFGTTKYRFLDDTYNESIEKLAAVDAVIQRLPFRLEFESYIRHELLDQDQLNLLNSSGLKSAILGIETLNKRSGESIGKGMAAERTLEIVQNLRTAIPHCYIATGMIIGLAHDSMDNIDWAYQVAQRSDLFDKINWAPLVMRVKSELFTLSELEEKYTDYGYTVTPDGDRMYQNWTNQYNMTFQQAVNTVLDLEQQSIKHGTFSPNSRYALTLENIGITNLSSSFSDLDQRILYNTIRYKSSYVKKILEAA